MPAHGSCSGLARKPGRDQASPGFVAICSRSASGEREICRGFASVPVGLEIERDGLTVVQLTDTCTFQSRHVDENVLRAALRSDEAKAFGGVEPFHGAISHRDVPFMKYRSHNAA